MSFMKSKPQRQTLYLEQDAFDGLHLLWLKAKAVDRKASMSSIVSKLVLDEMRKVRDA